MRYVKTGPHRGVVIDDDVPVSLDPASDAEDRPLAAFDEIESITFETEPEPEPEPTRRRRRQKNTEEVDDMEAKPAAPAQPNGPVQPGNPTPDGEGTGA